MCDQSIKVPSKDIQEWSKILDEEDNKAWGVFKATAKKPGAAYEAVVSSLAGQVKGLKSDKLVKAATTAGIGSAAIGTTAGPAGAFSGFVRGFMSVNGGVIEATSKMGEFIQEYYTDEDNPQGRIPTPEEFIDVYNNKEQWKKFRTKSATKGLTIAYIDKFSGDVAAAATHTVAKTGKKLTATAGG